MLTFSALPAVDMVGYMLRLLLIAASVVAVSWIVMIELGSSGHPGICPQRAEHFGATGKKAGQVLGHALGQT